jgi:hypothetical protein
VRQLDVSEGDLPLLAEDTRKNFNANPGVRSDASIGEMLRLLQAAW